MLLAAILVPREAPRRKAENWHGGSNASIESHRGTQYYNPSPYPPHSLEGILVAVLRYS
jgi:hypothetical protein